MANNYLGSEFKKLGFGFMRLPMNGKEVDMEQTKQMVDTYMSKGFTYFDTAYVYIEGKSESYFKEAVVDRYPRDSFQIATKLPLWGRKNKEEVEKIFAESLEHAGVDYYDFYLIHALNRDVAKTCDELEVWDFMKKIKENGTAKHIGFSFHDAPEILDQVLTAHPEMEFVQLQINYIDWESNDVQSRECYEVALKHNKPIIIMEPVKGGNLANVTPDAEKLFKDYNKDASPASWAVRYAASNENIITVLSGMSTIEQVNDNTSYMENFVPLCDDERKVIDDVIEVINKIPTIPCTDCKYCVEGCPMSINIPQLFKVMNAHKKFDLDENVASNGNHYENATQGDAGKASDCVGCGACQSHCPQHIEIIEQLSKIAKLYE